MNRLHILMLIGLGACTSNYSFQEIECIESGTDYIVFKPCRQLIYRAKYWDQEYQLISDEKIWMMANGKQWIYEAEKQSEIVIQYEYDETKIESLAKYSINPELSDWTNTEVTGVIETSKRIWMHPFRQNQYNFMEVAPFPTVELPLEIGKSWTGKLNINNWGVWSNSSLNYTYKVLGYEEVPLDFGKTEAWHIESIATATFGNSSHNFWFHPDLGFVKMVVHNYEGQTLELELIDVVDN